MRLNIRDTLLVASSAICLVNCQVCVLKQRPDPSQGGNLTWSLPYDERCMCQAVVAPQWNAQSCGPIDEYTEDMILWYVNDPRPLTNRMNWNKETLDSLLDRDEYCGMNECASGPCEHGGTCHDRIGKYICTCLKGFSGERCETDVNECIQVPNPCHDNADCFNTEDSYRCQCQPGYDGDGDTNCTVCTQPAGMEDRSIPDNQITATDYYDGNWAPYKARLNNNAAWSNHANPPDHYIQVVLNQPQYLTGVVTQGIVDAWVTHYKVEFSPYDTNWEFVSDTTGGPPKIFAGNKDNDTPVTNMFPTPIRVSTIRLWPTSVHIWIHMRLEFLACSL